MAGVVFYVVLLVIYVWAWAFASLRQPTNLPEFVTRISGLIGILGAFGNALQKASLRVYFLYQKALIKLFSDTTGRWWLSARYEGNFPDDTLENLVAHLSGEAFRFNVKIDRQSALDTEMQIDETFCIRITMEPAQFSHTGEAHIDLVSHVMEVSYGHAKKKLETQIIPTLQALGTFLKPENSSFELNVRFMKANPFFAVYIAHLRPDQVNDYKVVLHVDASHPSGKAEKVEINKDTVHVTARSTDGLKELAEQFVLLSPDLKMLKGARSRA